MSITFLKKRQKWRVQITLKDGERKHIGLYTTYENALWAWGEAKKERGVLSRPHKGVYFLGWKVIIKTDGEQKYIGTFNTLEAALNAKLHAEKDCEKPRL